MNFFEGVFSTLLESTPKKIFIVSRTASMNIFEECTHDYFLNIHLEKCSTQPNGFNFFFLKVDFRLLSELAPKKTFVIS